MTEELKPCPFCGGEPGMVQQTKVNWAVMCHVCGAEGGWSKPSDAIALWNRRATPQQAVPALTDAQIEELWRAYQLGQVSADHTAKEVFFEVMKINLRVMLVTSPTALTDEQILHMAEGIKFDDEDGAENLVAFVRKLLAAPQPSREPEKAEKQKLPRGGGQSFKSVNEAHEKAAYPKYQD